MKLCRLLALPVLLLLVSFNAYAGDDKDELPVPRFASLRSGDVNMRVGPGSRYSINWVYKHEGLPVEITREFDEWREIRDADGTVGWVHKQMLQGKRNIVVKKGVAVMRKSADAKGTPVIRVEPGVVGKLLECEADWCRVQIAGHKGWMPKTSIWGVYKNEKL